ncbi:MAG: hypothetical protein AAFV43_15160 [Planctomycetota bacterium]
MAESQSSTGEFAREPVAESRLMGPGKFWGMYAGEHCAGTEFMIGPLFLGAGASLGDLLLGLLVGNVLAVLTWRYLVVPIAISKRLTLYYQLERIAGPGVARLYNVVNGVLFCFFAGAMVTVSASAIGIPFGVFYSVPEATFGFGSPQFTAMVLVVGAVMTVVAAAGYETVARVANYAAPWMIVAFAAAGFAALRQMGVDSWDALVDGAFWRDAVAFIQEKDGATEFGFWQIVVFAWLCNGAMHFGMADLSIFRFARHPSSGWAPSIGMLLGHYMAWIAAALLLAAQIKLSGDTTADPGLLAYNAIGWAGITVVVVAGWTTANPTIYRAGLAFQRLLPRSSRIGATVAAGMLATIAGAFPNLSAKLLDFVGAYGAVLGPMGAVVFVDYWLIRRFGLADEYSERTGAANLAALVAWLTPVLVGLYLIFWRGLFAAYAVVPAWLACGALYLMLSVAQQRSRSY